MAVKAMSLRSMRDWKQLDLFQREAKTLESLQHPCIPKYLDFFEEDTEEDRGFFLVQVPLPTASPPHMCFAFTSLIFGVGLLLCAKKHSIPIRWVCSGEMPPVFSALRRNLHCLVGGLILSSLAYLLDKCCFTRSHSNQPLRGLERRSKKHFHGMCGRLHA